MHKNGVLNKTANSALAIFLLNALNAHRSFLQSKENLESAALAMEGLPVLHGDVVPSLVAASLGAGLGGFFGNTLASHLIDEDDPKKERERIRNITVASAAIGGLLPLLMLEQSP